MVASFKDCVYFKKGEGEWEWRLCIYSEEFFYSICCSITSGDAFDSTTIQPNFEVCSSIHYELTFKIYRNIYERKTRVHVRSKNRSGLNDSES